MCLLVFSILSAQSRLVRRAGLQDTLSGAASAIACVSSCEQYPSKQLKGSVEKGDNRF